MVKETDTKETLKETCPQTRFQTLFLRAQFLSAHCVTRNHSVYSSAHSRSISLSPVASLRDEILDIGTHRESQGIAKRVHGNYTSPALPRLFTPQDPPFVVVFDCVVSVFKARFQNEASGALEELDQLESDGEDLELPYDRRHPIAGDTAMNCGLGGTEKRLVRYNSTAAPAGAHATRHNLRDASPSDSCDSHNTH